MLHLAPSVRLAVLILIVLLSITTRTASASSTDTLTISAQARARIDFKVNLSNFDKTYHGNDSAIEQVLARIDSMVLDPSMSVGRITVVGTASPEGLYSKNVSLATERAGAFISILKERYSFPDSIYAISTIPEDWDGMRMMLAADNTIPYGAVVLSFLDKTATSANGFSRASTAVRPTPPCAGMCCPICAAPRCWLITIRAGSVAAWTIPARHI